MNRRTLVLLAASFFFLLPPVAFGQGNAAETTLVPSQAELETPTEEVLEGLDARRGLDGMLAISGNVNLVQNSSVVGQVDGVSTVFGLGFKGGLDWLHGRHEWRNTLMIDLAFSRTPVLSRFVKNNDVLLLSTQYNYFFLDWMGAFGRFSFETAMFPNADHRAEKTTYVVNKLDGTKETHTDVFKLDISNTFEPITLAQSIGIISDPLRTDPLSLTIRLGLGGRESFTKTVLVLSDDDKTKELEFKELDNVYQFGLEAFVGGNGNFFDGRLSYDFGVSAMFPFVNNDEKKRTSWDLARIGVSASVNFAVFSWMGLTYKLYLLRDIQVVDKLQVQNSILATFNYTFIERNQHVQPVDAAILELEKAQKEKAEAEARAKKAELALEEAKKAAKKKEEAAKIQQQAAKTEAEAAKANKEAAKTEKATDALNQKTEPPAEPNQPGRPSQPAQEPAGQQPAGNQPAGGQAPAGQQPAGGSQPAGQEPASGSGSGTGTASA